MLEPRSPITSVKAVTGDAQSRLCLSERPPGALMQIAGWSDLATAAAPCLSKLDLDGLGDYQHARKAGSAIAYRIAPDRLLLRHSDRAALLTAGQALDPETTCSLDLSHARWVLGIEGPAAPGLLARLVPIDCDPAVFPVGRFVQTAIHHVGVLLHRYAEEQWELLVPVTWAQSLWDYLLEAASPLDYRLEPAEK